eukprot:5547627-Amphidinium_carterae.2
MQNRCRSDPKGGPLGGFPEFGIDVESMWNRCGIDVETMWKRCGIDVETMFWDEIWTFRIKSASNPHRIRIKSASNPLAQLSPETSIPHQNQTF